MSSRRAFVWLAAVISGFGLVATAVLAAEASGLRLEAILVWATNEEKPRDLTLKELEPGLARKLRNSPYKWNNYFEVNRRATNVPPNAVTPVSMSDHCALKIKNLGEERLEVNLIGKGKAVSKNVESLPLGHIMVIGGDATNGTAWFIVLRQPPAKP